jgi:hypothetical protein
VQERSKLPIIDNLKNVKVFRSKQQYHQSNIAMERAQPNLPPLSTTAQPRHRRSKSVSYNNSSPEWHWKLSPILPELWIRDANIITPAIIAELEKAWLKYQTLGVPGKGDGASLRAKTRAGRKKIQEEYRALPRDVRKAKEVALARWENFVIRGRDGTLDYHTDEERKEGKGKRGLGSLMAKVFGRGNE